MSGQWVVLAWCSCLGYRLGLDRVFDVGDVGCILLRYTQPLALSRLFAETAGGSTSPRFGTVHRIFLQSRSLGAMYASSLFSAVFLTYIKRSHSDGLLSFRSCQYGEEVDASVLAFRGWGCTGSVNRRSMLGRH